MPGGSITGPLASVEIYDPQLNSWASAASLNLGRHLHTATLLPNGKLLVAGGEDSGGSLSGAELYDPAANTWSPSASLNAKHRSHTATLLQSGMVLVTGGYDLGISYEC